jgi:hypothetical protein
MMAKTQEPDTAPRADKWYRLKLGPTISEQNSSRFYTLRCKSFTLSLSLFVFFSIPRSLVHAFSLMSNGNAELRLGFQLW